MRMSEELRFNSDYKKKVSITDAKGMQRKISGI